MRELIEEIIAILRSRGALEPVELAGLIRRHNRDIHVVTDHLSKKKAMQAYLAEKRANTPLWQSWNVDHDLDLLMQKTLQVKPRRTASGVATITVITKPMPCSGTCLFCPNDVRMPKSYLTDEPACQRAERNYFDPYLQVASRMKALREMGHETDKIELIVLGGTWDDYPQEYQIWFATELFRALNDEGGNIEALTERRARYAHCGIASDPNILKAQVAGVQQSVFCGALSYNEAHRRLYGPGSAWEQAGLWQTATLEELEAEQRKNESARHRVVGLVVETRPDAISAESLSAMRKLGCTKVQMGIQTLDKSVMAANGRSIEVEVIKRSFALLRLFGFKIHVHFMLNLYGSNPEADVADYLTLVNDLAFLPDEIKLYPCVMVEGTGLSRLYEQGLWAPYDEEALVNTLAKDVENTPPYMRISRMIRDISAHDIKAGNRKTNLRQMVEQVPLAKPLKDCEIRMREISVEGVDVDSLELSEITYETSISSERFLQWITSEGRIAGFLRLSLPHREAFCKLEGLPVSAGEAMIREVHVYGRVARLADTGMGAQHLGLGRKIVKRACEIASNEGYGRINVISSVGTRNYYRKLGFQDAGLYQVRSLEA
ncbi:MAG: tRNA uridine(34) 5-carboxymethylaminomethyl modification radical SAM/GNAT enzyme Elp3 [Eggerthellaceae bacterium]|nr:tRNA uridine(34) 5-carboxymethylaminomethyl modification radical SAM/GNAT enzyme Elp3 [Eggerthellaceae bacterium]